MLLVVVSFLVILLILRLTFTAFLLALVLIVVVSAKVLSLLVTVSTEVLVSILAVAVSIVDVATTETSYKIDTIPSDDVSNTADDLTPSLSSPPSSLLIIFFIDNFFINFHISKNILVVLTL